MENFENMMNTTTLLTKNEDLQYLMQIGLTRLQANIYLNLLRNGKADARIIAYWAGSPRTEVYRALNELQEKGLVDREVGCPLKFAPVPPSLGLQAFIDKKLHEVNQMQTFLNKFSLKFECDNELDTPEREYKIISIEGRRRIIAKIKQQHDNAKFSVDVITFLPRFLYIASQCMENYYKAIERGVKYRIIIGMPNGSQDLPTEIKEAHNNANTIIKKAVGCLRVNSAIYDQKQINFSYYPNRHIAESPLILTNHPCLIDFAINSFQRIWESL